MSKPTLTITAQANKVEAMETAEGEIPRLRLNAYNGGKLRLSNFEHPLVVDLSSLRLRQDIPLLRDHNDSRPVGHTEQISATSSIDGVGVLSMPGEDTDKVLASSKANFPWQISIGAEPGDSGRVFLVEKGNTATVNDNIFEGPVLVATGFELSEFSLVPRGADNTTSSRLAASYHPTNTTKDTPMPETDTDASDTIEATEAPETNKEDSLQNEVKALRAEHARISEIDNVTDGHPGIRAKAVSEGWSPLQAELETLKASRPVIKAANGTGESDSNAIKAAFAHSVGVSEKTILASYGANSLDNRDYRGIGIVGLAQAINAANGNTRYMSPTDAFKAAIRASSLPSVISLPEILSDVANKVLLDAYLGSERVGEQLCRIADVNDFKANSAVRLDLPNGLAQYTGGEIAHVALAEAKYSMQARTHAGLINISRTDIVNDDSSALQTIPEQLGVAASDTIEENIFTTLKAVAGTATGGSALSIDTVAAAMAAMRLQKVGKKLAGARMTHLVVPPQLEARARQIANSTNIDGDNGTSNPVAGMFQVVVSDWLGDDATKWYAVSDRVNAIGLSWLRGSGRAPVVETSDADFSQLGWQARVYVDAGVTALNPFGAMAFDAAA